MLKRTKEKYERIRWSEENETRAAHDQILSDWERRTQSHSSARRLTAEIGFLHQSQLSDSFRFSVSLRKKYSINIAGYVLFL